MPILTADCPKCDGQGCKDCEFKGVVNALELVKDVIKDIHSDNRKK